MSHPQLDIIPSALVDESEVWADETDTVVDDDESDYDYDYMSIPDSDSEIDDDGFPDLDFILDDINRRYLPGGIFNPIDLTGDD